MIINDEPLISVCVPAYNRVDTVLELINSFDNQDAECKELIISDDSTNNSLENTIRKINRSDIKYIKNSQNIGFSKNLKQALLAARGKYMIVLGDDDVLLKQNALSEYIKAFEKSNDIYFVYSNQVQFSEKLVIECLITMFQRNKLYISGETTLESLWLSSIFIGGLGLRNNKEMIRKYYSENKILHPQVELVGNLLMNHSAYVISDYLIGFRTRQDQFIFRAMKDRTQRQSGRHQNTEIYEIFNRLKKNYSLELSDRFVFQRLLRDAKILMPKEKMILGSKILKSNYLSFTKISQEASNSHSLFIIYTMSQLSPAWLIIIVRKFAFILMRILNYKTYSSYKKLLIKAIS